MRRCVFFFLFSVLLLPACKTAPGTRDAPAATLTLERIRADRIDRVTLHYRLRGENPRSVPVNMEIRGWKLYLNGLDPEIPATLTIDGNAAAGICLSAGAKSSAEAALELELDLAALPDSFVSVDEYLARIDVDLVWRRAGGESLSGVVSTETTFPRIREPVFTITSIAILQAELINTRFRVGLRIDNPNPFPVALSTLGYELYGDDRFWADGKEQSPLPVPAQGSAETNLSLTMNFTNMKRRLLDEITAMRPVRYRFTGEAEIGTGVSWLPSFRASFDHSGSSTVQK